MVTRKTLHLWVSSIIVILAGLYYGLFAHTTMPAVLDFAPQTTDSKSVFSALMFLYIGIAAIWLSGIFKPSLWRTATLLNIVFMACLALGRLLSICLDGWPSPLFSWGCLGEAVLAIWGIVNLRLDSNKATK